VLAVSSSQWALRQRQRRARNEEIENLDQTSIDAPAVGLEG
jgi:hypothetical protein